jgi:hypothetical protein
MTMTPKAPDPKHRAALVEALRKIDPSWSGKCPNLPKPLQIRTPDGRNPVDEVLARERDSRRHEITPERMGGEALRLFANIARELGWTTAEQVGISRTPEAAYLALQEVAQAGKDVAVGDATMERVSHVLGVYKELETTFPGDHCAWLRRCNTSPLFGGITPLDLMISDPGGLVSVRRHLECAYGGWA